MKIYVVAIGKIKESYISQAIDEYVKRCSRFAKVCVVELPEAPASKSPEEIKRIESEALLSHVKGDLIALDKGGKLLSSEEIASFIDGEGTSGVSELTFVIGGSYGLTDEVLKRAKLVLSFGRVTFAHQLFRAVLLEQIYRALTINAGLPYHK